jgi:hypothetical protein
MLQQAIVDREEQGETLSRLLPGGLAEKIRRRSTGRSARPSGSMVTVLMSDIRSYSDDRRARRPEPAGRPAEHAPGRV